MGECFSIPTLSLSEAERRVYHNWSLTEAPHHQRVSDTLMMLGLFRQDASSVELAAIC